MEEASMLISDLLQALTDSILGARTDTEAGRNVVSKMAGYAVTITEKLTVRHMKAEEGEHVKALEDVIKASNSPMHTASTFAFVNFANS
jgi:hypothetical protein